MEKETIITGIYINVNNQTVTKITTNNSLDNFQNLIKCSCIDGVTRTFNNNKQYVIYCDDLGTLKQDKIPAAIQLHGNDINEIIFGNVLIFSFDDDGNTKSISEQEINELLTSCCMLGDVYSRRCLKVIIFRG